MIGFMISFRGPLAAAQGLDTPGDGAGDRSATAWTDVVGAALISPETALPVADARDRAVWGRIDPATRNAFLIAAEADRGDPWPQPLASAAARVHRDGDREQWQIPAFARQQRLTRAAVAAALTADDAWIDEVADGVVLLCEQSSWCWPAHDDTFEQHGAVLATVDDPYLDLGAGEAVGQLAWLDHLLGAALDVRYPGLRERIRREARLRVFEPFLRRRDWHWLGLDGDVHNWNPWIHGNVLVAALRLLDGEDDAATRTAVIALAIEGLDRYVAVLPADGAIDEGYEYWWNGACRALEALDVLAHATAGRVDLAPAVPALRETVAFPHRVHLGGDWYLNLADGQARPVEHKPWHALHRAARRIGDADAAAHAATHRHPGLPLTHESEGLGRVLRALTDADWAAASAGDPRSPLPREVWFASTEVLIARERAGTAAGLTLAVKGGHNGEHHNHNDVGGFLVASDGVPVVVDAGRPTYTKQTFGPRRYDIWTMQSAWHNVPQIAGHDQSPGATFAARDVAVEMTDAAGALSLDLAGAYDVTGLASWRRSARLDRRRGAGARVEIRDAWELTGDDAGTALHLLVAGEVALEDGGARVQPLAGAAAVRLRWPADVAATAEVRVLDDPMLTAVWGATLTRIRLDVAARREVTVTVERDEMIGEDHA